MKINKEIFQKKSTIRNMKFFLREDHYLRHIRDRIQWHFYPRLRIVRPFPTHVDVEIANACNLRCTMCYQHDFPVKKGLMNPGLFRRIVDECTKNDAYSIKLSWRGEPLLHPGVVEFVRYAKESGLPEVAFLTNGVLLTEEKAEGLVQTGLDWVGFSIDGIGKAYEVIRKGANGKHSSFEDTVNTIKMLRRVRREAGKNKPQIKVQTVVSAVRNQMDEYRRIFKPITERVSFIYDRKLHTDVKHDPNFICPFVWQRLTVTWSGKVVQCISDIFEKGEALGDMRKQSIREIWNGPVLNKMREYQKNRKRLNHLEICRSCRRFAAIYKKPYGYVE